MAEIDEIIKKAEERLRQLRERKAKQDRRERALSAKRERAADTRRKILLGAMLLGNGVDGLDGQILARLSGYLTRADDRALFGLDPLPAPATPPPLAPSSSVPDKMW